MITLQKSTKGETMNPCSHKKLTFLGIQKTVNSDVCLKLYNCNYCHTTISTKHKRKEGDNQSESGILGIGSPESKSPALNTLKPVNPSISPTGEPEKIMKGII